LPNQNIVFWSGGWVKEPNEKRVQNTAVFETITNTDANFLNLHIDKATFINNTFYNIDFQTELFTAHVKCNGTVI